MSFGKNKSLQGVWKPFALINYTRKNQTLCQSPRHHRPSKFSQSTLIIFMFKIYEYPKKLARECGRIIGKMLKMCCRFYLVQKDSSKVELLCCFGEISMTNHACMGAKRAVRCSGYVCLCVTGSIFRLVFQKKYDQLNENG